MSMCAFDHLRNLTAFLALGTLAACTGGSGSGLEDCESCEPTIPNAQVHEFGSFGHCRLHPDDALLVCEGQYSEAANFSIAYWNVSVESELGIEHELQSALRPGSMEVATFDLAEIGWVPGAPLQITNQLSLSEYHIPIGEIEQTVVLDPTTVKASPDGSFRFDMHTGYEAWDVFVYGDFEATFDDVRQPGQWLLLEVTNASLEKDPKQFESKVSVISHHLIHMPVLAASGVQPVISQMVLTTNASGAERSVLPLEIALESPGTYFFDAKTESMRLATEDDFLVNGL